jgi:hypothetical protein
MASLSDSELLDVLLPLIDSRPEFRVQLGRYLIEALQKEIEVDQSTPKVRAPVFKKPMSNVSKPPVSDDPAFGMFTHVRRLIIHSQKPLLRDFEIDRVLEEEWTRVTDAEKAKWLELARAQKEPQAAESAPTQDPAH